MKQNILKNSLIIYFQTILGDDLISGSITTTISDHYAQFLLKKDIKFQQTKKKNFFEKIISNNFKNSNDAQLDFELK